MSFGDHLDELRSCLIRGLLGAALATALCLYLGKGILVIVMQPLIYVQYANGLQPNLQALSPASGFIAYLKIAFLSGLIVSMPWLLWQVWRFIAMGLYPRERRFARWLIGPSVMLFVLGVFFLYFVVLPLMLQFFISFNRAFGTPDLTPSVFQQLLLRDREEQVETAEPIDMLNVPVLAEDPTDSADGDVWVNSTLHRLMVKTTDGLWSAGLEPGRVAPIMSSQFAIDFYVSFVLMLALAFGIAFETPLVVFFLSWTGLVPTEAMKKGRRYVLLATVVSAAVLTPPDVISQVLLAGPMYLLFEAGMFVACIAERRSAGESAEPAAESSDDEASPDSGQV